VLHTVAFGPHVHTDVLAAARSAGWETVLPRSQFSARLAEILTEVCQPRTATC
jgi:hypothetical protein